MVGHHQQEEVVEQPQSPAGSELLRTVSATAVLQPGVDADTQATTVSTETDSPQSECEGSSKTATDENPNHNEIDNTMTDNKDAEFPPATKANRPAGQRRTMTALTNATSIVSGYTDELDDDKDRPEQPQHLWRW